MKVKKSHNKEKKERYGEY